MGTASRRRRGGAEAAQGRFANSLIVPDAHTTVGPQHQARSARVVGLHTVARLAARRTVASSQTCPDEQREHRRAEEHRGREQPRHAERAWWVAVRLVLVVRSHRLDNALQRGLVRTGVLQGSVGRGYAGGVLGLICIRLSH